MAGTIADPVGRLYGVCGHLQDVLKTSYIVRKRPEGGMANGLLITAIREAGLDVDQVAEVAGVRRDTFLEDLDNP